MSDARTAVFIFLQGATIKLPHTGNTEGKVLGRLGSNESNKLDGERKETSAGELVFTSMDSAESSTFRPLLTSDDQGWLAAGGPFAGQVRSFCGAAPTLSRTSCSSLVQNASKTA